MKRTFFALVISVTLFGAPALFACERCIQKGSLDPNGNGPYLTGICWSIEDGRSEGPGPRSEGSGPRLSFS